MKKHTTFLCAGLIAVLCAPASADDLTLMVEKDLAALGYATGPVDGEETMETVIAISKFQAENQLEVTGEVTPMGWCAHSSRISSKILRYSVKKSLVALEQT